MKLMKYKKKRDFTKTPEPKAKIVASKKKRLFVVQKHAASHLHYDFRLEFNGVLLSWAVPKGPCLDPTVKRLAVHVEDHPLSYGSFEGTIPKGQYGGGAVMLWDKGEWISTDKNLKKAYEKGDLNFTLKGKKLKGKWKLIRMHSDDKTWLLLKAKDAYSKALRTYDITKKEPYSITSRKLIDDIARHQKNVNLPRNIPPTKIPKTISPELATLVTEPPSGKHWLHEMKFDGYRLIAIKTKGKTTLFTRNQHDWTAKFKSIAKAINDLPIDNIILDGEIVVLDGKSHTNFQLLQNSIKEGKGEFIYYTFDLLYIDKYNITSLPLVERKKLLRNILPKNHAVLFFSDHIEGSGKALFKKFCALSLEGLISKDANSTYIPKRTKDWLKTKCIKRQEFVIGGFTLPKNSREHFGSLLLGTYNKKGEFIYHGHVGTGFTQTSLKSMYQALKKHVSAINPFQHHPAMKGKGRITWVEPSIVAEVEFTEWTEDGILRHPSFKGIRKDKPVKEIKREKEVRVKNITSKKRKSR